MRLQQLLLGAEMLSEGGEGDEGDEGDGGVEIQEFHREASPGRLL